MAEQTLDDINPQMDVANLYTEELITDRKVGTIHVLTPITPEGSRDASRPMIFLGEVPVNHSICAAKVSL